MWIDRARTYPIPGRDAPDILRRGSNDGLVEGKTWAVTSR